MSFVNLQYVDDMLIFGQSSIREEITIRWALCYYEAWSSLKINFAKSSLVCLGSKNIAMHVIREVFPCKEEQFPITYLEILVKPGKLMKQD